MATIIDYLTWRGDLTFAQRPFNTVDNIVLSALAYFRFGEAVPATGQDAVPLSLAIGRALAGRPSCAVLPNERFVRELARSRRFGPALVNGYQDLCDRSEVTQFGALTIRLPHNGGTYVAFRGTDNSLTGWREDFLLGSRITGAQRRAARYLLRVMAHGWEGKLFVGGHSKGANLALYAALVCPQSLQNCIERVFCNDGPGIAPEVLPGATAAALGSRLVRLVPQYCIVGALFDLPQLPRLVVKSTAQGILQHDVSTWMVGASEPMLAEDLLPQCRRLSNAVCSWIAEMSVAERDHVVQEMFDVLAAGGATELTEVFSTPSGTSAVLRALRSASDLTKRAVRRLARSAGHSLLLDLR